MIKKEIKALMKAGVPKNELRIFNFSQVEMDKLIWLKKNEFDLDGNLFDVVRKWSNKDGSIHLECISDKKEKELFSRIGEAIANDLGNNHHPTPLSNWLKLVQTPAIIETMNVLSGDLKFSLEIKHFFEYKRILTDPQIKLDSPPPCLFS